MRHELANARQEAVALKSLLKRAAAKLEHLLEDNSSDQSRNEAREMAERLGDAASR